MTLKELLDKVEFDALCPYLEKYEPKHLDNTPRKKKRKMKKERSK